MWSYWVVGDTGGREAIRQGLVGTYFPDCEEAIGGGAAGLGMRSAVTWHVVRTERARLGWLGLCAGTAPLRFAALEEFLSAFLNDFFCELVQIFRKFFSD